MRAKCIGMRCRKKSKCERTETKQRYQIVNIVILSRPFASLIAKKTSLFLRTRTHQKRNHEIRYSVGDTHCAVSSTLMRGRNGIKLATFAPPSDGGRVSLVRYYIMLVTRIWRAEKSIDKFSSNWSYIWLGPISTKKAEKSMPADDQNIQKKIYPSNNICYYV